MPTESLREDILRGNSDWVPRHIEEELKKSNDPLTIMNEIVIPAIREVGDKYEHREIYLPQVIAAAEATTIALKILKPMFSAKDSEKGKILVATVYGDVHDIGKNLVKALLESHGFDIVDLGKNVKSDRIIEALSGEKFFAVGLSALMTTTLPAMERTVLLIHREFPELPVIIGGAAVCEEFAQKIDANYAKDAVNAAKIADRLCLFLSSNFPVSSRRDSNK
ncbi:cobalamin-dependent protein [bacterium]|nr:cobalamin-dependent protein [bacterium]